MRIPNLGETDLLLPLHEGVFEQPMWRTFLARLRRVSGADVSAVLLGAEGEPLRLVAGDAAALPAVPLGDLREGRVYSGEELDLASCRTIRVPGPPDAALVLAGGALAVD
ncbi:MAG: hypothetical protein WBA68_06070, partial [Alteraurantiacibacter sp.]